MMHDKLRKLIEKKKARGEELSPIKKATKKDTIEDLIGQMGKEMKGNLKKVTVASSSKEGIEKGLKKAQEIMGKLPSDEEMEEMTNEAEGGHEEESEYGENASESPEAIKAEIKKLQAKLEKMEGKESEEEEESEESEETEMA